MLAWQLCDFQGIQTSIAKKPEIFVIFQGGGVGPDPLSPPLDPHMDEPQSVLHSESIRPPRGSIYFESEANLCPLTNL